MSEMTGQVGATVRSARLSAARRGCFAVVRVVGFCALTALAGQVWIPLPGTDVPMTLQPVAVLLTGYALAPRAAAAAMGLFITMGALGLPLFGLRSAGLGGSTGGYLIGFLVAAWLTSVIRGRGSAGFYRLLLAGAVGMFALFVVGVWWKAVWLGGDVRLALATGFAPFAVKAVVELLLTAGLADRFWTWRRRVAERDVVRKAELD